MSRDLKINNFLVYMFVKVKYNKNFETQKGCYFILVPVSS